MLASLVALLAAASPVGPQSTSARPSAPQVVAPRETPSGARSPARIKLTRKGAVTRRALTGAPAQPSQPSAPQPTAPAGTVPFTPITTPAPGTPAAAPVPDPAALERALAMPQNADFKAWYEADHGFETPRGDRHFIPSTGWEDGSNCIERWDGDTRYLRPGCRPAAFQLKVSVDRAYGEALESHFGFPMGVLERVACRPNDGSCDAVEAAVESTLAQHGIRCTPELIIPDHQWIMDRSVPELRAVAISVINAVHGAGAATDRRDRIAALASFVQNAVPYRHVRGAKDDLMRDGKSRCGLRTPIATLFEGGDCDSKALLLATLIRAVDATVPLALVHCMSGDEPHMCLAVGCDRAADEIALDTDTGIMLVVETTSDWDLGRVSAATDLQDLELSRLR
jgi:hypothetical protein